MRRLALLIVIAVTAAACGGDSDGVSDTTTTTREAGTTTTTVGGEAIVAEEGDVVAVHYVGTLDDGTQFDASRPRGSTLDFTIGSGQMIGGFDQGVRGMAVGEIKTIRIEPADAYGEYDPAAVIEVDVSLIPEDAAVGDVLFDQSGQALTVLAIEGDIVTMDANHQLAGEALTFEIEMVAINP